MWGIRFLNGPQAGQIFPLKPGKNILGRGPHCDVQVNSVGASKEHCEIQMLNDRIAIRDLQSRNGTVLNGVRIQAGFFRPGDRIAIHDVIFELASVEMPEPLRAANYGGSPYTGAQPQGSMGAVAPASGQGFAKDTWNHINQYIERVALPGVYKLPELAEFKWVICGFLAALIFLVTLMCMLPAMQVARSSLLIESKRRAQSLARTLAQLNQTALMQGTFASVSTHSIESEEGVKQAFIVQQVDGLIVAPATLQGKVSDLGFVHKARLESKAQTDVVDGSSVGASFPIGVYDPATGEPNVKYHAIIMYDVKSLALDDGRAISLFMQALLLSSLVGLLLFYFMYKMIEYPILNLNAQLDTALREKKDSLQVTYQFPALQNFVGNINSLLTRYMNGDGNSTATPVSQAEEAAKVAALVSDACLVLNSQGQIMSANSAFEQLARVSTQQMRGQTVQVMADTALIQNIEFLVSRARENPYGSHTDTLDFSGVTYQSNCQAFGQPIDFFIYTAFKAGSS